MYRRYELINMYKHILILLYFDISTTNYQHHLNITSLDSGFKMAAGTGRHCNYPISRHIMIQIKQTQ